MSACKALAAALLIVLVAVPSFLVGQRLHYGDPVLLLTASTGLVVLLAGAIMRQME